MFTVVSSMLPVPLAVKPFAPPVAVAVNVTPDRFVGNVSSTVAPRHRAGSAVGNHDRIGDRAVGRHISVGTRDAGAADVIDLGDRQIDRWRQVIDIGGRVVARRRVGRARRIGYGGHVRQGAGGGGVDRGDHGVSHGAADGQVHGRVVDVARAAGREAGGPARRTRCVGHAGQRGWERIGYAGAGRGARAGVGHDDRIRDLVTRHGRSLRRGDARSADVVDLGNLQVGLGRVGEIRIERLGTGLGDERHLAVGGVDASLHLDLHRRMPTSEKSPAPAPAPVVKDENGINVGVVVEPPVSGMASVAVDQLLPSLKMLIVIELLG